MSGSAQTSRIASSGIKEPAGKEKNFFIGAAFRRIFPKRVTNIGTAKNLFQALKSSLEKKGLDFSGAVAFMSDTTNVMKGARSGVQKLIKNENPTLYDVGCICHVADLTVKAGMQTLPINIDQLFVDIYYVFYHSSKRTQQFADLWHSLFQSDADVILKHCTTRWLSLLRCVGRYLKQLEGLKSFFRSSDEETSKVRGILERLENPLLKPLLLFLSHIMVSMDRFNRVLKKSTENTTCELFIDMSRLVKLYASNVLNRLTARLNYSRASRDARLISHDSQMNHSFEEPRL